MMSQSGESEVPSLRRSEIGSFNFSSSTSSPAIGWKKIVQGLAQRTMSGKYAFTKSLKELRFLHCQTSEHSNAVRYDKLTLKCNKRTTY